MTLVEKLRTVGEDYDFHDNALIFEAADRIEELEAELIKAKEIPMKYKRMEFNAQLQNRVAELEAKLAKYEQQEPVARIHSFVGQDHAVISFLDGGWSRTDLDSELYLRDTDKIGD